MAHTEDFDELVKEMLLLLLFPFALLSLLHRFFEECLGRRSGTSSVSGLALYHVQDLGVEVLECYGCWEGGPGRWRRGQA